MPHKANSAGDCINQQPEERQIILSKLRETINQNLPKGFEGGIQYGMISYFYHTAYIQMDTIVSLRTPFLL